MKIDIEQLYAIAMTSPEVAWCIAYIFVWFFISGFGLFCLAVIMKSKRIIKTEKDWRTK